MSLQLEHLGYLAVQVIIPVTFKPAWLLMYISRVDCLIKGIHELYSPAKFAI